METRWAEASETARVRELNQNTYHDPIRFADFYYAHDYVPERTRVGVEDGKIVSSVQEILATMRYLGKDHPVGLLYGGTVDPAYEHRGYVKRVVSEATEDMLAKGCDAVIGFINLAATKPWQSIGFKVAFPMRFFSETYAGAGDSVVVKLADFTDAGLIPHIDSLYEERFADCAHIRRSGHDWVSIMCEYALCGGGTLLEFEGGVLRGYVVFQEDGAGYRAMETVSQRSDFVLRQAAMRYLGVSEMAVNAPGYMSTSGECVAAGIIRGADFFPYEKGYLNLLHM